MELSIVFNNMTDKMAIFARNYIKKIMEYKKLIEQLGFTPKENTSSIYHKRYALCGGYGIDIDFNKEIINFGDKITCDSKTTQNFSQPENFVVLECVNRLLEKGYKPEDITLEKIFPSGHGHSGRLDIFVRKEEKAFLMIECKTYGKEYDKELKNIYKNGGQLFTYFQNDTNTQFLMLYASRLHKESIDVKWDIVKVEDHYRGAGNVADFYDRWSKVTFQNGIFEDWVSAYRFENKLLTKKELLPLKETDSNFIFHEFMSILRKHSVSDEPNAFNKIFNLFLAKIYDEKKRDNDELEFQWKEKTDDPVEFQIRLINLYQKGMFEFLRKEIKGIDDSDFKYKTDDELHTIKKRWLTFNNVFAIKEVVDDESFEDNHRVLKEVVELLHKYQIRYPRRQAHLSDFFERLLTTGLKQKAGQFFSPPPITRFIVKSLPLKEMVNESLKKDATDLPAVIDYAVGSGHFITEIMEEYQNIIDYDIDTTNLYPDVKEDIAVWQRKKYDWAAKYIYGIEKDYRLVKVAKVGCYFYGDGLAQIIHGDGLDSFKDSKSYVGRLKNIDDSELEKFSVVVSNPPYSVPTFKGDLRNKNAKEEFELYNLLTDRSSEIECLFIERTKQLLKDGGIAGIILPSSILNNAGGLYTTSREIILQHFDVIAISELGSNTFMATGTNTVVLFLRRKYKDLPQLREYVSQSVKHRDDRTINGVQNILSRYVNHVWEGITLADYTTLLQHKPNAIVKKHKIYKEYENRIKNKSSFEEILIQKEEEKILYFALAEPQKVVLVKTGEKEEEKDFLGYWFSNRRGSEGMHPMQRNKTVDECTSLYNVKDNNDYTKANTYIRKAFKGDLTFPIDEKMKNNVSRINLVDMLTFDRIDFDKSLSLTVKKKIKYEDIWKTNRLKPLSEIAEIRKGTSITKRQTVGGKIPVIAGGQDVAYYHREANRTGNIITVSASGAYSGFVNYFESPIFASDCNTIQSKNENIISTKLIYTFLKIIQTEIYGLQRGQAQPHVYGEDLESVKIPFPSEDVQRKIIKEIEKIEEQEKKIRREVDKLEQDIEETFSDAYQSASDIYHLSDNDRFIVSIGKRVISIDLDSNGNIPVYSANVFEPFGYINKLLIEDFSFPSILWGIDGDWMVNFMPKNKPFYPTDHCGVLRIIDESILPRYVAWVLHKEGQDKKFSRQLRASIDRITSISIKLPPLSQQQKVVSEVEKIELQIMVYKKQLTEIPRQKEAIIKKYL